MPRVSTLVSVVVHAVIVGGVLIWSVLAPDRLPSPRTLLAYEDVAMVKIQDIPLPAPPRRPESSSQPTVSTNAAPLDAPARITEETGLEGSKTSGVVRDVTAAPGIDGGIPGFQEPAPPPPPPPAPPPAPIRPGGDVQPPRKIVDVRPVYPPLAQAARREGVVILDVLIDADGSVARVTVLRSVPLLDDAAVAAVRQWKFTPTRLNGQAVPIVMTVTVSFNLR